MVVRPLVKELQATGNEWDGRLAASVWPFFIFYYFFSSIVLFNIIVAILLDEFICAASVDKFARRTHVQTEMPLDPILEILSGFSMPSELHLSISTLFTLFDSDVQGSISFVKMRQGLERLAGDNECACLSGEDWDVITGLQSEKLSSMRKTKD